MSVSWPRFDCGDLFCGFGIFQQRIPHLAFMQETLWPHNRKAPWSVRAVRNHSSGGDQCTGNVQKISVVVVCDKSTMLLQRFYGAFSSVWIKLFKEYTPCSESKMRLLGDLSRILRVWDLAWRIVSKFYVYTSKTSFWWSFRLRATPVLKRKSWVECLTGKISVICTIPSIV